MIEKVKVETTCELCYKSKLDCFIFKIFEFKNREFGFHICESCLNKNGIISFNKKEIESLVCNQMMTCQILERDRHIYECEEMIKEERKLYERLKNVKAE